VGSRDYLVDRYGLSGPAVADAARRLLERSTACPTV
jgi:hypothetical protein